MMEMKLKEVGNFLRQTVSKLELFLNSTTLKGLEEEEAGRTEYYKHVLATIRKLTVYCGEGYVASNMIVKAKHFSERAAQRTLYRIYTHCIEEFFSPKSDVWYENSRSAYTGQNSIQFRENIPGSIRELIGSLERDFQRIREELDYFESDYPMQLYSR